MVKLSDCVALCAVAGMLGASTPPNPWVLARSCGNNVDAEFPINAIDWRAAKRPKMIDAEVNGVMVCARVDPRVKGWSLAPVKTAFWPSLHGCGLDCPY